jgi:HK97 family phage prohead protease
MFPGFTESIDSHAFDKAIAGDVRALWNHDTNIVLGRTTAEPPTLTLKVDSRGLYGEILINPEDTDAMNAYARIKRGDVRECSFGFDILKETISERSNGNWHSDILEVELYEISPCTFPAYKETSVSARSDEIKELRKRETDLWKAQAKGRLKK